MTKSQEKHPIIEIPDHENSPFFMVKNEIVTEYRPIIGATGFDLYGFYKQMANRKEGETLYPSLQLTAAHLNIAEITISCNNWLLECCGLLKIKTGNARTSNYYTLLPVRPVTPELLVKLTDVLQPKATDGQRWARFKANRLEAVKAWQPLRAHFKAKPTPPDPVAAIDDQITADTSPQSELVAQLVEMFKENKLTESAAEKMIADYGVAAVKQQLAWLPNRKTNTPLKTLRAALKGNWDEPKAVGHAQTETFTPTEKAAMMANSQRQGMLCLYEADSAPETTSADSMWQEVKERLQMQMTQVTFDSWVKQTQLVSITGNQWLIQCASTLAQELLENRLNGTLTRTASSVAGQQIELKFIVRE